MHSLDNIFTCIRKILFRSFGKCYGLFDSELPLARHQPLKIQFRYFFADSAGFFYISTLDISRTVAPKAITIPFSERTQKDLSGALKYFV